MGAIIALFVLLIVSYVMRPDWTDIPAIRAVYNWGAAFRVLGTLAYMFYAFYITSGNVDAFVYDNWAQRFAEYFVRGDFSPFTDSSLYRGGQLFYTNFVAYPAAFFLIITGNSTFGIYLLFSTVCFIGLVLMVKSFYLNFPGIDRYRVTLYVLLFPAVWFWTSTIGKDAFVFLGIGIICSGFRVSSLNYVKFIIGIAIVYAFRPPVAYMLLLSMSALFIFNFKDPFLLKLLKIGLGVYLAVLLLDFISADWKIESFDVETIEGLQRSTLRNNDYGSGALEEKSGGLSSIPRGIVDVLARPFIWETKDITTLLASLEITFMLSILFIKRYSLKRFVQSMLTNRLSTFVGAFTLIYIVSAGLFENNIGLIARHRSIIFPFLFLAAYSFQFVKVPKRNLSPTNNYLPVETEKAAPYRKL